MRDSKRREDGDVQRLQPRLDAVGLEVLWARLVSIADEAAATLVRTSFSTVVREANDYACGLTDVNGDGLVENSYAIPGFIGAMPMSMKHFLKKIPLHEWSPGDSVVTNDPWMGSGHLPDIVMATPIFYRNRIVAFATSVAHAPDIGGAVWSIEARELFEEGLRIPIMKLFSEGLPNETLIELIRDNVRVPDQVIGDLFAARAAANVCAAKLIELFEDERLENLEPLGEAMQGRSEAAMRKAISDVPDGGYYHSVEMDGFEEPLTIAVGITVAGETLTVDYTGTSSQIDRAINCPYVSTFAHTTYALKCILDPKTPRNDGSYRPIRVVAPRGTLVNPNFPAAVAARQIVVLYLNAAVFGALAPVLSDQVIAESGTPHLQMVYSGVNRRGQPYVLIPFDAAGMGARPSKDGLSCTPFPTNAGGTSVEIMENLAPLLFHGKSFASDSGGAGEYRGGLGQEIVVEMLSEQPTWISVMADRVSHAPRGILGGKPGMPARIEFADGRPISPKGRTRLKYGDEIRIRSAGGGGYGPPDRRHVRFIERDVAEGLCSAEAMLTSYPQYGRRSERVNATNAQVAAKRVVDE